MEIENFKGRYIEYPYVVKKRYKIDVYGNVYDKKREIFLNRSEDYYGYFTVSLRTKRNGKEKTRPILLHRLVATTFLPNEKNYPMVNHLDGNKQNPCVTNLEWCDARRNNKHAIEIGLRRVGEDLPKSIITNAQARKVCELLQEGKAIKVVCKETGIKRSIVHNIKNGVSWKHISKDYDVKASCQKRIDEKTARQICEYLELGFKNKEIQKILSVTKKTILNIRDGNTWKYISCEYEFPRERPLLKEHQVREICTLLEKKLTVSEISKETGHSYSVIDKISKRKTWNKITKDYHF